MERGVWGVVTDVEVSEASLVSSQGVAATPSAGVQVLQERVFYIGLTEQEACREVLCPVLDASVSLCSILKPLFTGAAPQGGERG